MTREDQQQRVSQPDGHCAVILGAAGELFACMLLYRPRLVSIHSHSSTTIRPSSTSIPWLCVKKIHYSCNLLIPWIDYLTIHQFNEARSSALVPQQRQHNAMLYHNWMSFPSSPLSRFIDFSVATLSSLKLWFIVVSIKKSEINQRISFSHSYYYLMM